MNIAEIKDKYRGLLLPATGGIAGLCIGAALTYALTRGQQPEETGIEWNGGTYYGDISQDGLPDGEGRLEKDGMTYTGLWTAGQLPKGRIESDKYVYDGELDGTRIQGYGVCRYKDGRTYRGYWVNDYKEGLGLMREADGRLSFGFFREGLLTPPDGQEYATGDRVYGIDAAEYQGVIVWQDLYLSCNRHGGVDGHLDKSPRYVQPVMFALIKSTRGNVKRDPLFDANFAEARRCGVTRGAYHFLSIRATGREQAEYYIMNTPLEKGDMPPILDFEKHDIDNRKMTDRELASMVPIACEWLDIIEKHYGVKPIIYTNMEAYLKHIATNSRLSQYDLWIASPGRKRPEVSKCVIWQFSHHGKAHGITENVVDLNIFNGTQADFERYVREKGIKAVRSSDAHVCSLR